MRKNEPIDNILTRDVDTVHTGMSVSDVRKLFAEKGFHHVPVVSGKKLLGMITASDVLGITVDGVGADERSVAVGRRVHSVKCWVPSARQRPPRSAMPSMR